MLAGVPPLAAPPVMPPDTTGTGQEYVVPAGITPLVPFAGVRLNVPPLRIVAVPGVTAGTGLTVTVTVNGAPAQLPRAADEVGVTV